MNRRGTGAGSWHTLAVRFVLIRHGQSGNNLIFATTGGEAGRHPDTPLTELGHDQARRLAESVAAGVLPWSVTHVYCSLMRRAVQTAAPLADALDLDLHGHAELFECGAPYDLDEDGNRVAHPGSGRDELAALTPRLRLPDAAGQGGWWSGPYEAEERAWSERAHRVIAGLRATHAHDDVVALVTHAYFTQFLLRALLGIGSMGGWFNIKNTAISLVRDEIAPAWVGTTTAERINWIPHLPVEHYTD